MSQGERGSGVPGCWRESGEEKMGGWGDQGEKVYQRRKKQGMKLVMSIKVE